jgi:DNA invertase Pin-like site-specific DNA recombinase
MGVFAEFETNLRKERQIEGIEKIRKRKLCNCLLMVFKGEKS